VRGAALTRLSRVPAPSCCTAGLQLNTLPLVPAQRPGGNFGENPAPATRLIRPPLLLLPADNPGFPFPPFGGGLLDGKKVSIPTCSASGSRLLHSYAQPATAGAAAKVYIGFKANVIFLSQAMVYLTATAYRPGWRCT
jgi:hypothetical protein